MQNLPDSALEDPVHFFHPGISTTTTTSVISIHPSPSFDSMIRDPCRSHANLLYKMRVKRGTALPGFVMAEVSHPACRT
jgi:hypothetical protein